MGKQEGIHFIIRDDDLSYFTDPQLLEKLYGALWKDFPVTFGAIPFLKGSFTGFIPVEYWHVQEPFLLEDNKELIHYLLPKIKERKIDIALHGIFHQYQFKHGRFIPELVHIEKDFTEQVIVARNYLERLFNKDISVFIPPSNTLNPSAAMQLKALGFHLLNLPGVRQRSRPLFSYSYTLARLQRIYFHFRYGFDSPIPLKINNLWEVGGHVLTPGINLDQLKRAFLYAYEHQYPFVLATHYWEHQCYLPYDRKKTQYDLLIEFLDFVSAYKIKPVTASDFVSGV